MDELSTYIQTRNFLSDRWHWGQHTLGLATYGADYQLALKRACVAGAVLFFGQRPRLRFMPLGSGLPDLPDLPCLGALSLEEHHGDLGAPALQRAGRLLWDLDPVVVNDNLGHEAVMQMLDLAIFLAANPGFEVEVRAHAELRATSAAFDSVSSALAKLAADWAKELVTGAVEYIDPSFPAELQRMIDEANAYEPVVLEPA